MSIYQDEVLDILRREGRATSGEMAKKLGRTTYNERMSICRACRSLLRFDMIRVVDSKRVGCTDVRVYELDEDEKE